MTSKSDKTLSLLWWLTGLAAILLLVTTIMLTIQAENQTLTGVAAQIGGRNPSVYLRDQPHGAGQILTALRRGTAVTLIDSTTQGNTIWYQVEIGELTGWVPATAINLVTREETSPNAP